MRQGVFVTGGSGFVGRRLLPELIALGRQLFVLDRSGALAGLASASVTVVTGDLMQPETYRAALRSCDVVVHLAAVTGAAAAAEHERVNALGTEVLLDECRKGGVEKIVFVSSIAATFPANTGYHYADAKRRAERAVERSGLRFTIVRPTVIAGPGSPNLKSLEKLALLPFIVMPGNGKARVQPIDVSDVARSIAALVQHSAFANDVVELGGPKVLTMAEHLQQIRVARTGRTGPMVRVPLPLFTIPLRAAESLGLGRWLPLTAGQLSSFRFDGVTAEHRAEADAAAAAECRVFTRYLLRCEPDSYVVNHYARAVAMRGVTPHAGSFDSALLGFARMGWFTARLADSYASLFFRTSTLRKRLVLLLALLEVRAPFHLAIDQAVSGPLPLLLARLSFKAFVALIGLVVASIVLAPAHLLLSMMGKGAR